MNSQYLMLIIVSLDIAAMEIASPTSQQEQLDNVVPQVATDNSVNPVQTRAPLPLIVLCFKHCFKHYSADIKNIIKFSTKGIKRKKEGNKLNSQLPQELVKEIIAVYKAVQEIEESKKKGFFRKVKRFFKDREISKLYFCHDFFVELRPVLLKVAYRCYRKNNLSSTAAGLDTALKVFTNQINELTSLHFECDILTDEIRIILSSLRVIQKDIEINKEKKDQAALFALIDRMLECSNFIARFSYPNGRKIDMRKFEKDALIFPHLFDMLAKDDQSNFVKEKCFAQAMRSSFEDCRGYETTIQRLASELDLKKSTLTADKANKQAKQLVWE